MKATYSKDEDILLLELSEEAIDHAEESEGVIVHFSREDRPVLLEFLNAKETVTRLAAVTSVRS